VCECVLPRFVESVFSVFLFYLYICNFYLFLILCEEVGASTAVLVFRRLLFVPPNPHTLLTRQIVWVERVCACVCILVLLS
jgi:hypothetical protein